MIVSVPDLSFFSLPGLSFFLYLAVDAQTEARDDFDHSVRNFAGAYCMIQLKL